MFSIFRHFFPLPELSLDLYETNTNDSTSDTYIWYVCPSIFWYDTTTLPQCCCMEWAHKVQRLRYYCAWARTRYILYRLLQKTPTAVVRATAASFVTCCLLYAIDAIIDGDGLLLLDVNCIQ